MAPAPKAFETSARSAKAPLVAKLAEAPFKSEPTKPVAAATPDTRAFRVQLGSYRSETAAKAGVKIFKTSYGELLSDVELEILPVTLPDIGDYFRVSTVPLASRVDAAEFCRRLRDRDVSYLILRSH